MWKNIPKPIFCLAPMAGITDSAFRLICKKNGADVVYSEMASASALFYKPQKTLELIRFSLKERPYIVQLFGKNPEHFGKAAKLISQGIPLINYGRLAFSSRKKIQPPDGIDLNFGCPAKKVFGHGSGAALMQDPELAKKIIEATVANTKLPVSLKVRIGLENSQGNFSLLNFLKKININALGVSAIMVHGRSYNQGFKGPIDYPTIRQIKKYFRGITIANGGIQSLKDARIMLEKTGADGVGIARGIYGQPFFFASLKTLKKPSSKKKDCRNWKKIATTVWQHANYAHQLKKEKGLVEMRKHLLWYFKGIPGIKKMRPEIVQITSLKDIKKIIKNVEKLFKN